MTTYYLINSVQVGTRRLFAGTLIDSVQESTTAIEAVGGLLVVSSDAFVAAAAEIAQQMRSRNQPPEVLDALMGAAYQASIKNASSEIAVSEIADGAVTTPKLGSDTSGHAAYPKTTAGAQTLLAAITGLRNVIIVAKVTEVFADGDGAQPTFTVGQTGAATKFAAAAKFTDAALGTEFVMSGQLTSATALLVTGTAATGSTSTGALEFTVLAGPGA